MYISKRDFRARLLNAELARIYSRWNEKTTLDQMVAETMAKGVLISFHLVPKQRKIQ